MEGAVDLHIHTKYSQATSKNMDLHHIIKYSKIKGLHYIGTGDCLHPSYYKELKEYNNKEHNLVLTVEVEDKNRVHHLIIIPNLSICRELYTKFKRYSHNIDFEGRPKINLTGKEIMDICKELDCLIGPAHAFTPWTSIYKTFDSILDCYEKYPDFVELGLSADTDMADRIPELRKIVFLSNSDAHSYHPHRLGREFNVIPINNYDNNFESNFEDIRYSILKKKIKFNVGLDPRLGKYHLTACSRCYTKFKTKDAVTLKWKCPLCGGHIKKGVLSRIEELGEKISKHPDFRPPYIKIIPLLEIIALTYNKKENSKVVKNIWEKFIQEFNNEVDILIKIPIEDLNRIDPNVAKTIALFRDNKIYILPGGGGKYGEIHFKPIKINWYTPQNNLNRWLKK